MNKLQHRPHNLPDTKKRIVQLIDSDVTKVDTSDPYPSMPAPNKHPLNERYNPLPHLDGPVIKPASTLDKGKCQAMADWQTSHYPTCNNVHEATWGWDHFFGDVHDVENTIPDRGDSPHVMARLAAGGAFRHVWMIREFDGTKRALKTLRSAKSKEFDLRNFDRHRRDAVAMERLTSSPLVVDIYGYCANSALFDWGEGGDLLELFSGRPVDESKLLKIAYNVTLSIAHAHYPDERGRATMAHTDIKPDQFLYQDGYYRLTDFNRVRFLMWNDQDDKPCGFTVGKNGGVWRSPEEYEYEKETEKVDVFSLGNVLYYMLTEGTIPWKDKENKEVYALVSDGKRPPIPNKYSESDHVYHQYMIKAMEMAYTHDFRERPSAFEIAEKLKEGIEKL